MLEELRKLIAFEGVTREDGLEARKIALEAWISRYVTELTVENLVIKKHLTPTESDYMKYHLGLQVAEKIIEHHALVVSEGNKIKVKVLVLNKDFPKNKE